MHSWKKLVIGQSGTGKSTLSRELLKSEKRLIILDPGFEWERECFAVDNWRELVRLMQKEYFRISVQIEDDPLEVVDKCIRLCRSADVGNCVFAVEELSLFFEDGDRKVSQHVSGLVRFGRRERVHFFATSQRYIDCPIIVRSHITELYAFRTHEEADIQRLSKITGKSDTVNRLRNLPDGQYIVFDLSNRTEPRFGKVKLPHEGKRNLRDDGRGMDHDSDRIQQHESDEVRQGSLNDGQESSVDRADCDGDSVPPVADAGNQSGDV